jgi:hypothetical protein
VTPDGIRDVANLMFFDGGVAVTALGQLDGWQLSSDRLALK